MLLRKQENCYQQSNKAGSKCVQWVTMMWILRCYNSAPSCNKLVRSVFPRNKDTAAAAYTALHSQKQKNNIAKRLW